MKARVSTLCVKALSYFPHDSSPLLQRSTSERSCMIERDIMTLLPCKSPSHEHFTSESPFVNWSPNWLSDPMATIQIERSSTFVWKKCYFVLGDIFGGTLAITTLLPFEIRIPMAWCHNPLCLPHSSGMYPSVRWALLWWQNLHYLGDRCQRQLPQFHWQSIIGGWCEIRKSNYWWSSILLWW